MSKYLLELGTEELPYRFIPQAINSLKSSFTKFLDENKTGFEKVEVYATPRRLAVIISGLEAQSPDEEKIVKGPIAKIAYDEAGNLTKAGEGFARKNGLEPKDLYVQDGYVHAKIIIKGKSVKELLSENVPSLILKLQGSHFMRWGYNEEKFSRPIRWIVSILDGEEVKIKIIDKESSNVSRGHRFDNQHIVINHPDEYVEKLREAHVIVNQDERRSIIVKSAEEEAAKLGAVPYYTDDLLEEVTFITEYPVPALCEFDPKYLEIPEEVTVTVMAVHQRYFALRKDGKLINKFITMTNYIGDEFSNIRAGNVRVIKARLDDAVFFFREDTKKPLGDYVESLRGVTFQKGMGSVYDKARRLVALSADMAKALKIDPKTVERTAALCKADLTTQLVFEFTELQGFIGADYARVSGEDERVCEGIKEHYFPLNAESETAKGIEGQLVGIADKLDTVCAVFAEGKKPTGSSDPLGVRRAALGIIRTVLSADLKLDINDMIIKTLLLLPIKKEESKSVIDKVKSFATSGLDRISGKIAEEVKEFMVQRLIIFLGDKHPKNVLEACASNKNPLEDLADYVKRVEVVEKLDNPALLECANRVLRILKEDSKKSVDKNLFREPSEKMLLEQINTVNEDDDYAKYLQSLIEINPSVEKFFNDVLVMDKDEKVKENRLALLTLLKKKYARLTDFSKL